MKVDLTGKTVLVTGASRGIGRAIAWHVAGAGAAVAIHYNTNRSRAEELSASLDTETAIFQADLIEAEACDRLFDAVVERFRRVDVLVNNAGIARHAPLDDALDTWEAAWDATLAVNLKAAALLCRRAVLHFREYGGGRIINVASRAAFRGDTPAYLAYAASKGGMVALTRSIARGLGKEGIRAFVLAPGFTRTDMAQAFIDEYGEAFATGNVALERLTEPDDVAPLAVMLASGLADHATGATIDVNAGSYVH